MDYVKLVMASLVLTVFIALSAGSVPAAAHVLESDNGVSAILHFKPDDRPVTDKPMVVRLLFSSETGGFKINDYDVKLSFYQNDTLIVTGDIEPAFFGANAEGSATITFPNAGAYKVKAVGKPVKAGQMPFELNYTARVNGPVEVKTGDGSMPLIIGGFSFIMLGMVAVKGIQSGARYRSKKT